MRPNKQKLYALYWDKRLTTRQIADIYGVSHTSVKRWLKKHGIPRRAANDGLLNRGVTPPTEEELYHSIHIEHLSYVEVAAMFGVDTTAVPYWLKKHGIKLPKAWDTRRNGNRPQLPDKQTLQHLYWSQHLSHQAIGSIYGISGNTISRLLKKHEIKSRPSGHNGGARFTCLDGHKVRSGYEQRVDNWLYEHGIPHEYEPTLPFDRRMKADFLANGYFVEVWGVAGNPRYTARKKRKQKLYADFGLPLIEIPYHAFDTAHNKLWERRLGECKNPTHCISSLKLPLSL